MRRRRCRCRRAATAAAAIAVGGALALASAGAGIAQAAFPPGFPDTSFGAGGQAPTPFGTGARAAALALGPGGAITVAGDLRGSGGEGVLVARFTAAGALDPTFAGSGARVDRFGLPTGGLGSTTQRGSAVAVAPDGSTIVAGVSAGELMLARYAPDGALDPLFGAGGVVLRDLSAGAGMPEGTGLAAVALTPSGQLVVAGSVGVPADDPYADGEPGEQVVVGRLSATGLPDPAFGRGGFTTFQLGARSARRPARSRVAALAIGPGDTIVLAGRASGPGGADRAVVARLTASGALDAGYGRAGRRVLQLGLASAARPAGSSLNALTLAPDGAAIVAGRGTDVAGRNQVVLARLRPGGALEPSYGRAGVVRTQVGAAIKGPAPESSARATARTGDGLTFVTGSDALGGAFTLRLAPSGRLDCGYGTLGQGAGLSTTLTRSGSAAADGAFGVLAQPDGAYVGAGRLPGGGLLLARVTGGPPNAGQTPARRPGLRTIGARYLGGGRAVLYGAVLASCSAADVRFVASPAAGRAMTSRLQHVSGAFGPQLVCAVVRGLKPGRTYRVRIDSRQTRGPVGGARTLRTVRTGAAPHPQSGCA